MVRILEQGRLALTLGGDHSVGLGSVAGSLDHCEDTVVFWVDAHADINTMSSSSSGNMHGMPVSFNIPSLREQFSQADLSWLQPKLDPSRYRDGVQSQKECGLFLEDSFCIFSTAILPPFTFNRWTGWSTSV